MTPAQRSLLDAIVRDGASEFLSRSGAQKALSAALEQLDAADRLFLAMETSATERGVGKKKSGFFLRRKEYIVLRTRDLQTQWICNGPGCKCSGDTFDCQCEVIAGSVKRARPICKKCHRPMRLIDADSGASLA